MRSAVATISLALAVLAGCGADQDPTVEPPPDATSTTTASEEPTSTTTMGSTSPVSVASTGGKAYLVDVRVAAHEGYERVAFEFREPVPGYQVRYVERPITEDGSGDAVEVEGGAVIEVRLEPASGFDTEAGTGGQPTYTGPRRIDPGTAAVRELVRTGDFEAVLTWVVGVDRQRPFRVTVAGSPKPVLIIDIATA